jgi:hypothetical protein
LLILVGVISIFAIEVLTNVDDVDGDVVVVAASGGTLVVIVVGVAVVATIGAIDTDESPFFFLGGILQTIIKWSHVAVW